jgi:hypothetical protein
MDLVAANPRGDSRLLAGVVVAVERGHAARLAAEIMVGSKNSDHFPDDTFVLLAVETYGCLDSAFDGFLGTCARLGRRASGRRFGDSSDGVPADLSKLVQGLNQLAA